MTGNLLIQKGKEIFSILNFGIEAKEAVPRLATGLDPKRQRRVPISAWGNAPGFRRNEGKKGCKPAL